MVTRFLQANGRHSVSREVPITKSLASKLRTAQTEEERAKARKLPYLQLVGSLLYLAVMTRPDIMASMSLLCKYMSDPTEECFEAALNVLLYVSGTKDLKLSFV